MAPISVFEGLALLKDDRRPVGADRRDVPQIIRCKGATSVHHFTAKNRQLRHQFRDLRIRYGEIVPVEDSEITQLTRRDRAFLSFIAREPG